ncbi:MAG: tRNA (adenosine(37)-N6)-threonylcarbamoyltransferase complex ATPase subunit type 1 TsaE [Acidobacteriota bacterium]|nr:tRNA (adenosine(37)-N6)-threonylcarbamoyltransferase complex ATPase subunit type 1 TsaE [Acidobacteriota bacterium]MDH3524566.1 tRNA (adenosine(37)-N6)-threonylcarbamoyltransferase complex ATPase subunit type 1 TsaE [Acidobacteriota bacterium]
MRRWLSRCEQDTVAVGREIGAAAAPSGVVLLAGDLGTGKTVLVRGVAEALGIDPAEIQSPSFTLMRSHRGKGGSLLHVDLYRLEPDDVPELGLEEALHGGGVTVVEWGQKLPFAVPGAIRLWLRRGRGEREREIREVGTL